MWSPRTISDNTDLSKVGHPLADIVRFCIKNCT
jgi:hypothetical protein